MKIDRDWPLALLSGAILLFLFCQPAGVLAQSAQSWTVPTTISNSLTPLEVSLGNPGVDQVQIMALSSDGSTNQLHCFLVENPYEPVITEQSFVAGGTLFSLSHNVQRLPSGVGMMSYVDGFGLRVITASAAAPCSWSGAPVRGVITDTISYGGSELRLVGGAPLIAGFNVQQASVDLFTPTAGFTATGAPSGFGIYRTVGGVDALKGTRFGLSTGGGTDCVWATSSTVFTDTTGGFAESFVECANPAMRVTFDRDVFPAAGDRESIGQGFGGFHWFAYTHEGSGQVRLARLDPSTGVVLSSTLGPAPGGGGFFGIGMAPGTLPDTLRVTWPGHDVQIDSSSGISSTIASYPITVKGPVSLAPFTSSQFTATLATAGPGSLLFSVFPAQAARSPFEIPSLDRWGLLGLALLLALVALGLLRGLGGSV